MVTALTDILPQHSPYYRRTLHDKE